jgi:hypothetical protein
MESAYNKFLRAADLETWRECLQSYQYLERQSAQVTPRRLAEGLCIAAYVRWLASLCGNEAVEKSAGDAIDHLADSALAGDLIGSGDGVLVKSLIAAARGYHRTARAMLDSLNREIPLEILLLVMPESHAKRAQEIGQYICADARQEFLPAVYFYGHALLDLGYLHRVDKLLEDYSAAESNPLMIDLKGKLLELEGDWTAALEVYGKSKDAPEKSKWDVHEYRYSICSVIVNAGAGELPVQPAMPALSDEKLIRGMLAGGTESDQAEAARTASFVNACRWSNFDNWLVHYELGSLSFRRRRHAEAEKRLKIAGIQAPEQFRFAVNHLRFINLTWLSGESLGRSLPVTAETLECALEALQATGPESMKAQIRTWVAQVTRDQSLLAPVYDSGNTYEQAQAEMIRERSPYALQSWSATIAKYFMPRAFHQLIRKFSSCGFEHTATYLCDVAMSESWDDFFQLWELAGSLLKIRVQDAAGFSAKHFGETLSKIQQRLEELSEFEFPHLMRAWQLYKDSGRADLAAHALKRADALAESPEEHLILAIARNDRTGLDHLLRAERESTDRLERLEIARELARYGQMTRARRILKQERVFESGVSLEPLEYIIALECGAPCLTKEEIEALSKRAEAHLEQDLKSGLIKKYGDLFIERLSRSATTSLKANEWPSHTEKLDESGDPIWKSWATSLERLDDPSLLEEERTRVEARVSELGADSVILFHHIILWEQLFRILHSGLEAIRRLHPARAPEETPISRADSFVENARVKMVSRLWRDYLTSEDSGQQATHLNRVRDFYREEQRLENEWETLRRGEQKVMLIKAGYMIEYGEDLLAEIRGQMRQADAWPPFLAISDHMHRDIDALLERLGALKTNFSNDFPALG